jgi:hypothetical protein
VEENLAKFGEILAPKAKLRKTKGEILKRVKNKSR